MSESTAAALTGSFTSAEQAASGYSPSVQEQVVSAASAAFTAGKSWAILIVLVLTILGFLLVWFLFPRKAAEEEYYASVQEEAPAAPSS